MKKLFVLDTNVLLHDPTALLRFEEHDVFIPFVTLEELDSKKVGSQDINRNSRQAVRLLEDLTSTAKDPTRGSPLKKASARAAGRLYLQHAVIEPSPLLAKVNDNQYLGVIEYLQAARGDRQVVLVSKDLNLRVKARAMGYRAEDYRNDMSVRDDELVPRGYIPMPVGLLETATDSGAQDGNPFYRVSTELPAGTILLGEGRHGWRVCADERGAKLSRLPDYARQSVWGITPRNEEQNLALGLLLCPDLDFITLLGAAGTGKTLLTLAAALELVFDRRLYQEILFTRATVPMGEDIGFLPGTEEEKMAPWMGAVNDNLDVLLGNAEDDARGRGSNWANTVSRELVMSRLKIRAMTFMRGRSYSNKIVIVDEAQNLTARQMKSLITRAGDNTKVICLGNLAQIDTPYLSEGSSGLTYAINRFQGWPHYGHLILEKGERSRLASHANEVL